MLVDGKRIGIIASMSIRKFGLEYSYVHTVTIYRIMEDEKGTIYCLEIGRFVAKLRFLSLRYYRTVFNWSIFQKSDLTISNIVGINCVSWPMA